MVRLWLVEKRVVDFLLVLIELLSLSRLRHQRILIEIVVFERGLGHLQRIFQEERGVQVTGLSHENVKSSHEVVT